MANRDQSISKINQAMKAIYNNRTPIAKFKSGGRRRAQRGMETGMERSMESPSEFSNDQRNALRFSQALKMQQQKQQNDMLMQLKLQNDSLMQQNELLKTQIQKSDLINSARTTKQPVGSASTPKKRGGSNKRVKTFIAGNAGNVMRKGGSCLPGGRYSKKRR
jgi:hypothetical protein|tara:strand:+ start:4204 stop:4692 length:489 start_codon:yes stop_codon:yes gene_type:complete